MSPESALTARRKVRARVLLIEEERIIRDALRALLETTQEFEVTGSESSMVATLYGSAGEVAPEIILADFPGMTRGEEVLASLKARFPEAHAVVLTSENDDAAIDAALRAGAQGYVLRSDTCNDLFSALRHVVAGELFVSPAIRDAVASGHLRSSKLAREPTAPANELTDREREVIRLIAAGHRTREIAKLLSLSYKTIEKHRSSLMRKLGLRNASAVAAYAIAHGLG